jgi:hypothetical protein
MVTSQAGHTYARDSMTKIFEAQALLSLMMVYLQQNILLRVLGQRIRIL